MAVSVQSGRRFCAQWNQFFEYDSPACLRLRPIVSANHPLRKTETKNEILKLELAEVDARIAKTEAVIKDVEELIELRPEYAAFSIATRFFAQGYHEKYLASLEADFREILLPEEKPTKYAHNRLARYFSSPGMIDLTNLGSSATFQCVFSLSKRVAWSHITGFTVSSFDKLDIDLREKFIEDPFLTDPQDNIFVSLSLQALDANFAIDNAIEQMLRSGRLSAIGFSRGAINPYVALHRNVVIRTPERIIRFDWKSRRISYKGVSTRDIRHYGGWLQESESFARLVECYSEALRYASEGDKLSAVRALLSGLDLLFKPIFAVAGAAKAYTQADFRNYAARFMAMQAMATVFEDCFEEYHSIDENVTMSELAAIPPDQLRTAVATRLKESYRKYRVLNKATFVSRGLRGLNTFKNAYVRDAVRYYADFNHIILMRNLLVHENVFHVDEYYITELLQLFRSSITFRLTCFDISDLVPQLAKDRKGRSFGDIIYAYCMKLLLQDSEYLLQRGSPVFVSGRTLCVIHGAGWGVRRSKSLDAAIRTHLADASRLVNDYQPSDVGPAGLAKVELL